MAKYVRIQSTRPITVTGGLQVINMTDKNSQNPDKLNVKPVWPSLRVTIEAGAGYYPARIKEWTSVKILSEKEILTVGEATDVVPDKYKEKAEALYKELEYQYSKYEKQKAAVEKKNTSAPKEKKTSAKPEQPSLLEDED